jgi:hypothetical protein
MSFRGHGPFFLNRFLNKTSDAATAAERVDLASAVRAHAKVSGNARATSATALPNDAFLGRKDQKVTELKLT